MIQEFRFLVAPRRRCHGAPELRWAPELLVTASAWVHQLLAHCATGQVGNFPWEKPWRKGGENHGKTLGKHWENGDFTKKLWYFNGIHG